MSCADGLLLLVFVAFQPPCSDLSITWPGKALASLRVCLSPSPNPHALIRGLERLPPMTGTGSPDTGNCAAC